MDEKQKETSKVEALEVMGAFMVYTKAQIEHYTYKDLSPRMMMEIRENVKLINSNYSLRSL